MGHSHSQVRFMGIGCSELSKGASLQRFKTKDNCEKELLKGETTAYSFTNNFA